MEQFRIANPGILERRIANPAQRKKPGRAEVSKSKLYRSLSFDLSASLVRPTPANIPAIMKTRA
jgi:hypothetical protein